jgi:hypothetical protein
VEPVPIILDEEARGYCGVCHYFLRLRPRVWIVKDIPGNS